MNDQRLVRSRPSLWLTATPYLSDTCLVVISDSIV